MTLEKKKKSPSTYDDRLLPFMLKIVTGIRTRGKGGDGGIKHSYVRRLSVQGVQAGRLKKRNRGY